MTARGKKAVLSVSLAAAMVLCVSYGPVRVRATEEDESAVPLSQVSEESSSPEEPSSEAPSSSQSSLPEEPSSETPSREEPSSSTPPPSSSSKPSSKPVTSNPPSQPVTSVPAGGSSSAAQPSSPVSSQGSGQENSSREESSGLLESGESGLSSLESLPGSSAKEPESSGIRLPSVDSVSSDLGLNPEIVDNSRMNWMGLLAWGAIAVFVLGVAVVLLMNRRPPSGGSGRKRYHQPSRKRGKKRLLPDRYYRGIR